MNKKYIWFALLLVIIAIAGLCIGLLTAKVESVESQRSSLPDAYLERKS